MIHSQKSDTTPAIPKEAKWSMHRPWLHFLLLLACIYGLPSTPGAAADPADCCAGTTIQRVCSETTHAEATAQLVAILDRNFLSTLCDIAKTVSSAIYANSDDRIACRFEFTFLALAVALKLDLRPETLCSDHTSNSCCRMHCCKAVRCEVGCASEASPCCTATRHGRKNLELKLTRLFSDTVQFVFVLLESLSDSLGWAKDTGAALGWCSFAVAIVGLILGIIADKYIVTLYNEALDERLEEEELYAGYS